MNKETHYLKHKNIKVASLYIDGGEVYDVQVFEKEHLPYLFEAENQKNIRLMNNWIANRGIPFSREDYDAIIEKYSVQSTKELTILGMGLNLTDHYWIADVTYDKNWEDVNYFDNKFSSRIGELIPELAEKQNDFMNPDFSSNGHLQKIWIINGNTRCLLKAGSGDLKQEPYNETIASYIAGCLGIEHVEYSLAQHGDEIYSICPCMVNRDNEFINSFVVYLHGGKSNDKYHTYVNICETNGIKNAKTDIDKMIVLDYLIRNTDRNAGNFGILRNAQTLQWEKVAPVFDNGNSLWYNSQIIHNIGMGTKSECRSFTGENEKNMGLIGDISWFDKNKLNTAGNEIRRILKTNTIMENERIEKIASSFMDRVQKIDMHLTQKPKIAKRLKR